MLAKLGRDRSSMFGNISCAPQFKQRKVWIPALCSMHKKEVKPRSTIPFWPQTLLESLSAIHHLSTSVIQLWVLPLLPAGCPDHHPQQQSPVCNGSWGAAVTFTHEGLGKGNHWPGTQPSAAGCWQDWQYGFGQQKKLQHLAVCLRLPAWSTGEKGRNISLLFYTCISFQLEMGRGTETGTPSSNECFCYPVYISVNDSYSQTNCWSIKEFRHGNGKFCLCQRHWGVSPENKCVST